MTIELEKNTALVVIDLQAGIVALPAVPTPMDTVIANSAALAEAFRAAGRTVVLVNVDGGAPGRTERSKAAGQTGPRVMPVEATVLVPQLNRQSSDITVTKRTLGAFLSTDLDAQLKARGVGQIVLTGVSTTSGVESTARSAYELGYHVAFVTDAMSDLSLEAHEASLEHQLPKLGELGTTAEVLEAIAAL